MAIKSTLFLLAFVLLAMRMASSKAPPPPPNAPHHAPPPVYHHTNLCVSKCETHCKGIRPIKWCMKACTACCAKYNCVPDGSKEYCKDWAYGVVDIHGKMVKCPARR